MFTLTMRKSASIVRISKILGHGKIEIIRQAIDEFIQRRDSNKGLRALQAACGMWTDHQSLLDTRVMRIYY
jgi:hypothetical protein